jgi:hypothetical protein
MTIRATANYWHYATIFRVCQCGVQTGYRLEGFCRVGNVLAVFFRERLSGFVGRSYAVFAFEVQINPKATKARRASATWHWPSFDHGRSIQTDNSFQRLPLASL